MGCDHPRTPDVGARAGCATVSARWRRRRRAGAAGQEDREQRDQERRDSTHSTILRIRATAYTDRTPQLSIGGALPNHSRHRARGRRSGVGVGCDASRARPNFVSPLRLHLGWPAQHELAADHLPYHVRGREPVCFGESAQHAQLRGAHAELKILGTSVSGRCHGHVMTRSCRRCQPRHDPREVVRLEELG